MKRLVIFSLLSFFFFAGFSQKAKIKGDKYYANYSYKKAISKYEMLDDKDIEVKRKLAKSYYNINDFEKSMEYWKLVVEDSGHKTSDLYNYAAVLAVNENYEESEEWMNKYYQANSSDSRARGWNADKGVYKELQKDKGIFIIQNLNINSPQEDFGAVYYNDKIAFTSSRERPIKIIRRVWNWNQKPFLDIYTANLKNEKTLKSVKRLKSKHINGKLHDGPATFNKAGDFIVFTRNNYDGKSNDDVIKLQLFSSKYVDGSWEKPEPFSFNSNDYSVGHAALTPNGDTMYFASDMPGGYGGTDLYVIYKKGNSWTAPKNLGKTVNTEGNEMFPFIHESGMLFFASDGFSGLGGLDVFVSYLKNGQLTKPENLGAPINSSYDDFSLVLDSVQQTGFFSSNRPSGSGDDDIYSFRMVKPLKVKKYLAGKAYDDKGNLLANVKVDLLDQSGNVIGTIITEADGGYLFEIEQDMMYRLQGRKDEYKDAYKAVDAHAPEQTINMDLVLATKPVYAFRVLVVDAQTNAPIEGADVKITDNLKNINDSFFTSSLGDHNIDLSSAKRNDKLNYDILVKKEGYVTKNETYKATLTNSGEYLVTVRMEKGIEIPIIYFDFDKSNIRPDASVGLNKVVDIMNKYPTLEIELSSHTDCRGSKRYNQALSNRRAQSSLKYVRSRVKVNPKRIYGRGYGETRLANGCACEGNQKSNCSEADHQLNRRTEFKIIKY